MKHLDEDTDSESGVLSKIETASSASPQVRLMLMVFEQERCIPYVSFPGGAGGKEPTCWCRKHSWSLVPKDPLEEDMATHSCKLAWKIPWTEEPGGLQSIGSQSWS